MARAIFGTKVLKAVEVVPFPLESGDSMCPLAQVELSPLNARAPLVAYCSGVGSLNSQTLIRR